MFAERGQRRKVPLHQLPFPIRVNPNVHVHVHANWLQMEYIYCIYMYMCNYKHINNSTLAIDGSLATIYIALWMYKESIRKYHIT